eukprot:COSAG01_NODE_53732_length_337_cov_0.647059_2_plen_36_part_01
MIEFTWLLIMCMLVVFPAPAVPTHATRVTEPLCDIP